MPGLFVNVGTVLPCYCLSRGHPLDTDSGQDILVTCPPKADNKQKLQKIMKRYRDPLFCYAAVCQYKG